MSGRSRALVPFLAALLLAACASAEKKALLSSLRGRPPAPVSAGPELVLLPKAGPRATALISKDGHAHVFVADKEDRVRHVEVEGETVREEVVGRFSKDDSRHASIDAVEHPRGTLRVLLGESQFVRSETEPSWRDFKGSPCQRFVPWGDDLFCTFIAEGKTIGGPKRTDWTVGLFILLPVAWWSNTWAEKLVLAKEHAGHWKAVAVLDPETPEDAQPDYLVRADEAGNLRFLYFQGRGGGAFWVLVGAGAGGTAGSTGPTPALRYATLSRLALSSGNGQGGSGGTAPDEVPRPLSFEGTSIPLPLYAPAPGLLRPLASRFCVTADSGFAGLVGSLAPESEWRATEVRDGRWSPEPAVVAVKGLLEEPGWLFNGGAVVAANRAGRTFALLEGLKVGFWASTRAQICFVSERGSWTRPVWLGRSRALSPQLLAVGDSGRAFAAWEDPEGKLVGRWIE